MLVVPVCTKSDVQTTITSETLVRSGHWEPTSTEWDVSDCSSVLRVYYLCRSERLHHTGYTPAQDNTTHTGRGQAKQWWMSMWVSLGVYSHWLCLSFVCACVSFPATSAQQRRISGPDVCDLWSGRSCGGEASNVLNIISHRWRRVRTQQRSHTSGLWRRLSSPLTTLYCICVQAGRLWGFK